MRICTIAFAFVVLAACSKKPAAEPSTSPDTTGQDAPAAGGATDERPRLTGPACEGQGGKVVGDIGDGAIHKPDYRCPDSGEPPIGSIVPGPGEPISVEGAVCCK